MLLLFLSWETRVSLRSHSGTLESVLRPPGFQPQRDALSPESRRAPLAPLPCVPGSRSSLCSTLRRGARNNGAKPSPAETWNPRAFYLCALSTDHVAAPCHGGDQAVSRGGGRVFSFPSASPLLGHLASSPARRAGAGGAEPRADRGRQTVSFLAAGWEQAVASAVWSSSGQPAAGGVVVRGMWAVK